MIWFVNILKPIVWEWLWVMTFLMTFMGLILLSDAVYSMSLVRLLGALIPTVIAVIGWRSLVKSSWMVRSVHRLKSLFAGHPDSG